MGPRKGGCLPLLVLVVLALFLVLTHIGNTVSPDLPDPPVYEAPLPPRLDPDRW